MDLLFPSGQELPHSCASKYLELHPMEKVLSTASKLLSDPSKMCQITRRSKNQAASLHLKTSNTNFKNGSTRNQRRLGMVGLKMLHRIMMLHS